MSSRLTVCRLLGLLACLAWPCQAGAEPQSGAAPAWQIEALVGFTRVAPDDLNARVEYDTAWLDYLRIPQVTQQHEGELLGLDDAMPFAVRVTKRVGRHWTVGGGVSYLIERGGLLRLGVLPLYGGRPEGPGVQREFAQSLEIDPLALEVRNYRPHGLVGYDVGFGSRLRLGGSLAAGWSIVDCTLTRSSKALGGFYLNDRRTEMEMTGRGSAFAADALFTVRLALTARVGLLAEGGFAWNDVQSVSGALTSTERIQDGEATEVELEQVSRAEGRWINQPVSVQAATGGWRGTVPSIGGQGTPFTLNLSGWRWQAGVTFGL